MRIKGVTQPGFGSPHHLSSTLSRLYNSASCTKRNVVLFTITLVLFLNSSEVESSSSSSSRTGGDSSITFAPVPSSTALAANNNNEAANAANVRERRSLWQKTCNDSSTTKSDKKSTLLRLLQSFTEPPPAAASAAVMMNEAATTTAGSSKSRTPTPCKYTYWDLGANIGDSLDKFVNAGLVDMTCPAAGINSVILNIDTGTLEAAAGGGKKWFSFWQKNKMLQWTSDQLEAVGTQPEDYCYFGMEGNPELTSRLQAMQARTLQSAPRLVRDIFFFTQTVVAATDGTMSMFIQHVQGDGQHNAVGSSLIEEKLERGGHPKIEVSVEALSARSLLKQTVEGKPGGHLLIKCDIEGAEYAVLNAGLTDLCRAVESGVRIDLLLELHGKRKIGKHNTDLEAFYANDTLGKLRACGVSVDTGKALRGGSVA